ncbi:MAG TPA: hypothetical protein VFC99_17120 [Acidimicrobiia bacterium]|nr:hypothetical protein [Acidimicrobiia bacterium]
MTKPPVTKPPVTPPPTTAATGGHTAGGTPPTKPTAPTTTPTTAPAASAAAAATDVALRLDTYDSFQTFVKGLAADAQREAERSAAARAAARATASRSSADRGAGIGFVSGAVDEGAASAPAAPDLFPHGPLFSDTPAPLLPLGPSGLRSARSFVLLFGLSAVALGFLAFRARIARRHGMLGVPTYDERGDYVDFV